MRRVIFGIVAMMTGCSSDEPAPNCQQAIAHYYGAGCAFVNLETGDRQSQGAATAGCQGASSDAPDECRGEIDDWLRCVNETSASEQCDCSQEQMAIIRCE